MPVLAAPEIGELAAPVLPTLEVESIDPLQAPVLPPLEAPDVDPLEAPDLAPLRVEAIEFPEVRVPAIAVSAPELSVEAPVFAEPPSISVDAPEFLAVATPGPLPIDTTEFLRPRDRFGDIFGPSPIGGVSQVDELEVRLLVDGEMVQEGRTLVSVLRAETTAQKIRGIRNPLNV